jgi:hypothetical protein
MATLNYQELRLVADLERKWTVSLITYKFLSPATAPNYYDDALINLQFDHRGGRSSIVNLPSSQQIAFRGAVEAWSSVANLALVEVGDVADADFLVGSVRFSVGDEAPRTKGARAAAFPLDWSDATLRGDVWVSTKSDILSPHTEEGGIGFFSLLHEIGHSLGLSHVGSTSYDSWRYSVLSYNDKAFIKDGKPILGGPGGQSAFQAAPSKPMLFDIAAIQYVYGANANANTGDDTYAFKLDDYWPIQAIWDADGNDTIDGDGSESRVIDLNPGGESFTTDSTGTRLAGKAEIHIAFHPLLPDGTPDPAYANNYIENAKGGSSDDTILGNSVANNLVGGDGADTIRGGAGNDSIVGGKDTNGLLGKDRKFDRLYGGEGYDTYIYDAGDGQDVIDDSDGLGAIVVNGSAIAGLFNQVAESDVPAALRALALAQHGTALSDGAFWKGVVAGQEFVIYSSVAAVPTGARVTVVGGPLGDGGAIAVENFVNGNLGLVLDPTPVVSVVSSENVLSENGAMPLNFEISAPAQAESGNYLRLAASNL